MTFDIILLCQMSMADPIKMNKSQKLYKQALNLMPGGVNSPVRAFKAVGGNPVYIAKGKGCYIYDEDGNCYVDFLSSWGPLILGHSHPKIVSALKKAVTLGTSFGTCTKIEIEIAKLIKKAFPSIELLRMVNSGTEAVMSAIRLARGFTGRKKVVKFEGCYHGHSDYLLAKSGSGAMTFDIPATKGVPDEFVNLTITLPFNDISAFKSFISKNSKEIAAVIIEPVAGNMGVVKPCKEFLRKIREITKKYGILLIFDEVITGFRLSFGGAQEIYGIDPDITCLGKIIGGGLPVGAYGGKREIMENIAPQGGVYQAGTLSGNPVSLTAGHETLKILSQKGFYDRLNSKSEDFITLLKEIIKRKKIKAVINNIGSMFTIFWGIENVNNYQDALNADTEKFKFFFNYLLQNGIYWPPSQFETAFISDAHTSKDLEKTISVIESFTDEY